MPADKACILGRITPGNGEMLLSETGKIVSLALERIPEVFQDVLFLSCVIMPEHLHIYDRVCENIENNPAVWAGDGYFPTYADELFLLYVSG